MSDEAPRCATTIGRRGGSTATRLLRPPSWTRGLTGPWLREFIDEGRRRCDDVSVDSGGGAVGADHRAPGRRPGEHPAVKVHRVESVLVEPGGDVRGAAAHLADDHDL